MMKKYITKVECCGFPVGTSVAFNDAKAEDNTGVTGKLLCTVPNGGGTVLR